MRSTSRACSSGEGGCGAAEVGQRGAAVEQQRHPAHGRQHLGRGLLQLGEQVQGPLPRREALGGVPELAQHEAAQRHQLRA
ncbi:hypothetical protein ACFQZ4_01540 [Catellatospora coxensis]